jgi:hypothetical protein
VTPAGALLRRQLRVAHVLLEGAIEVAGADAVERRPPAPLARAAACYAEMLVAEDLIVNGVLAGKHPLALTTWAGRTGISELPPAGMPDRDGWFRRVHLDLAQARAYALAVRTATDGYLAGLPDEDLDPTQADLLTALVLDLATRRGEIGCLLGTAPPG